jgi:hypothetical protein
MRGCGTKIRRYADTKDDGSTGNMGRHVTKCWGAEAKARVMVEETAEKRREVANTYVRTGKLTKYFEYKGEGRTVTYSVIQHTRAEIR